MAIKVLKYDQFGPYKGIQANLSAKIKRVGPKNKAPPLYHINKKAQKKLVPIKNIEKGNNDMPLCSLLYEH